MYQTRESSKQHKPLTVILSSSTRWTAADNRPFFKIWFIVRRDEGRTPNHNTWLNSSSPRDEQTGTSRAVLVSLLPGGFGIAGLSWKQGIFQLNKGTKNQSSYKGCSSLLGWGVRRRAHGRVSGLTVSLWQQADFWGVGWTASKFQTQVVSCRAANPPTPQFGGGEEGVALPSPSSPSPCLSPRLQRDPGIAAPFARLMSAGKACMARAYGTAGQLPSEPLLCWLTGTQLKWPRLLFAGVEELPLCGQKRGMKEGAAAEFAFCFRRGVENESNKNDRTNTPVGVLVYAQCFGHRLDLFLRWCWA